MRDAAICQACFQRLAEAADAPVLLGMGKREVNGFFGFGYDGEAHGDRPPTLMLGLHSLAD